MLARITGQLYSKVCLLLSCFHLCIDCLDGGLSQFGEGDEGEIKIHLNIIVRRRVSKEGGFQGQISWKCQFTGTRAIKGYQPNCHVTGNNVKGFFSYQFLLSGHILFIRIGPEAPACE